MKVDVVVEMFNGIVDEVTVFKTPEDAKKYLIKYFQEIGHLNIEDDASEDDIVNEIDCVNEEPNGNEVHWFSGVKVKGDK